MWKKSDTNPSENLAKFGYKPIYESQNFNRPCIIFFGYTLKTKYRNLADFYSSFFPSLLTIENIQNHFFIFEFWQIFTNFFFKKLHAKTKILNIYMIQYIIHATQNKIKFDKEHYKCNGKYAIKNSLHWNPPFFPWCRGLGFSLNPKP